MLVDISFIGLDVINNKLIYLLFYHKEIYTQLSYHLSQFYNMEYP